MRSGTFRVAAFTLLLMVAVLVRAQGGDVLNQGAKKSKVTADPVDPVTVQAGKSTDVTMHFKVAPGYHVNSNKPKSDLLIPTSLSLSLPTDILMGDITYPDGKDLSFPFSPDEKLNVYTGDIAITALVRAAKSMPPGRFRVHGNLKYQACDDRACYPPTQVATSFDVKVLKAAPTPTTKSRRNPAQSPHVHQ